MACTPEAKHCTHPSVVTCLALFLFLAVSKDPSTSEFPSESQHNFQTMMPLRVKGDALLAPWFHTGHTNAFCVIGFIFHLWKQEDSTAESKEVSSGGLSELQINWLYLQKKKVPELMIL